MRSADGTSFTNFDVPAGVGQTYPQAINDRGQVSGYYFAASAFPNTHGFVRSADGTSFTDVDDPAGIIGTTGAYGINDRGQVVGIYLDTSGNVHACLATRHSRHHGRG